jgi:hypothetical protein
MEPNKVKQIFTSGTESYFRELFQKVDSINQTSKSRGQIEQLYAALRTYFEDSTPIEVKRDVTEPVRHLVTSGTDLYFRMCQLAPQGPKELVVMLAMDVSYLPESCLVSIDGTLSEAPEPLIPVRLLTFVLTKGSSAVFQPVCSLLRRTALVRSYQSLTVSSGP